MRDLRPRWGCRGFGHSSSGIMRIAHANHGYKATREAAMAFAKS
jgi:hypothetical protein